MIVNGRLADIQHGSDIRIRKGIESFLPDQFIRQPNDMLARRIHNFAPKVLTYW